MAKLEVKLDNINVYELESNDSFDYDALPEEKQKEIDAVNEKYERTKLQQAVQSKAGPCQCMSMELQERAMRRASLLTAHSQPGMPIQLELTQADIDQKDFVVILNTDDGVYGDIRCIVSHCKRCGEMHVWGDLAPLGDLLAHSFVDYDTTQQNKQKRADQMQKLIDETPIPPDGQPQFILENTETGEMTPADDFVRAMVGAGPMPDGMTAEVLDEKTDPVETESSSPILVPGEDVTPSGIIIQ